MSTNIWRTICHILLLSVELNPRISFGVSLQCTISFRIRTSNYFRSVANHEAGHAVNYICSALTGVNPMSFRRHLFHLPWLAFIIFVRLWLALKSCHFWQLFLVECHTGSFEWTHHLPPNASTFSTMASISQSATHVLICSCRVCVCWNMLVMSQSMKLASH